jgi:hypothetical protein
LFCPAAATIVIIYFLQGVIVVVFCLNYTKKNSS